MNDNKHTISELNSVKLKNAIESLFRSAALTHVDELTTVVRLDNIGKRYGIFMEGNGAKEITFQTGNPADNINGITIESLLAICIDRLEIFNAGKFPCVENTIAIENCKSAIEALKARQKPLNVTTKAGTQEK